MASRRLALVIAVASVLPGAEHHGRVRFGGQPVPAAFGRAPRHLGLQFQHKDLAPETARNDTTSMGELAASGPQQSRSPW